MAKYIILSRGHLEMVFPNGRINVWIENPDINLNNPAEIPLCLVASSSLFHLKVRQFFPKAFLVGVMLKSGKMFMAPVVETVKI